MRYALTSWSTAREVAARRQHPVSRTFSIAAVCMALVGSACALTNEFDTVLASYGVLNTVAGRGQVQAKGVNGWQPAMEGGNALDAELSRPHIAMADSAGNIYIADKDAHAIRKITPDGLIHTIAGTGVAGNGGDSPQAGTAVALNEPNGLYTLRNGTTYILDKENSKIRKLDPSGTIATVVTNTLPLSVGRGIWVSPGQDTIYYSAGTVVRKWTSTNGVSTYASGFASLGNIDVNPIDNHLYVADRGAHCVYRIMPDGTRVAVAGNGSTSGGGDGQPALTTGLEEVRAICFGPNGGYYLGTHDGSQVWYVDTSGLVHLLIDGAKDSETHAGDGESIRTPGQKISEPRGIAIAPNGDLLVTENDYGYVRVVDSVVRILEISTSAQGAVELSWTSVPGSSNIVEGRPGLTTGTWSEIQSTSSAPFRLTTSFSETPTNSPLVQKLYRVVRQQ